MLLDASMHPLLTTALAVITVPLVVIDAREHRLPNGWNALLAACGIAAHAGAAVGARNVDPVLASLAVGMGGVMGMLLLHLVARGGLGLGDVKLVGALGCVLAQGSAVFATVCIAFVLAAAWAAVQLLRGRYRTDSRLAFGPFILLGAWTVIAIS